MNQRHKTWIGTMCAVLLSLASAASSQPTQAADWEIDVSHASVVHRGILGHTWEFQLQSPLQSHATVMRGVAGGLAAENFDWRRSGLKQSGGKWGSTLQFLRDCRDNGWDPLITANLRGLRNPERAGEFGDVDPEMLAQLAADWVRYCNHIVHTYRQGDPIASADDRRIIESIRWEGEDVLLAPGEAAVPRVVYWELGNEPSAFAGNLPAGAGPHIFTRRPEDYVHRYRTISRAMLKADPQIRVGPCFADDFRDLANKPFVMAILGSEERIDFLSYHKYAHLMHAWPNEDQMVETLQGLRRDMEDRHVRCIAAIRAAGRDPAAIELGLTEFNAASWGMNSAQFSMGRALGTAIYMHLLIDKGYRLATHWDRLSFDGAPWPTALLMQRYVRDLGDRAVGRHQEGEVDLVATRQSDDTDRLAIWGYNLDPSASKRVRVRLAGVTAIGRIEFSSLGAADGRPSLLARNSPVSPDAVCWSEPTLVAVGPSGDFDLVLPPLSVCQWRIQAEMPGITLSRRPGVAPAVEDSKLPTTAQAPPRSAAPSTRPADPSAAAQDLRAVVEAGRVRLNWEHGAGTIAGQTVERCDDEIEFNTLKDVGRGTTLLDESAEPGHSYQYRVVTRTADGRTAYSRAIRAVVHGGATTRSSSIDEGVDLRDARLIGHWPLNRTSGLRSVTRSQSSSEVFGPARLEVIEGREGLKVDRGGYVRLDDPPSFPIGPGREGTISFWICTTDPRGVIFARNESHDGPAAYEYGVMLDPPGRVRWMSAVHVRGFKTQIGASDTPIADGKWHHVAITFKNTTGRFYVDGKRAGEFNSLEWNVPLKHPLLIGANRTWRPDLISPGIAMSLADLRFYDAALSATAVRGLAGTVATSNQRP